MTESKICPKCGRPVQAGSMFCTSCGARLSAGQNEAAPAAPAEPGNEPVSRPADEASAQKTIGVFGIDPRKEDSSAKTPEESLESYVKQMGPMSLPAVLQKLSPVLDELHSMHAQRQRHDGICPANLRIDKVKGTIRLLSKEEALSNARGAASMDDYRPVEMLGENHGHPGAWSDVYALSATIYYLITGAAPTMAIRRLYGETLESPSSRGVQILPAQEAALLRGLSVNPTMRFSSIYEFGAALYGVSSAPPSVSAAAPSQKAPKSGGKKGWLIAVIIAAAVLLLAAGMIIFGERLIGKRGGEDRSSLIGSPNSVLGGGEELSDDAALEADAGQIAALADQGFAITSFTKKTDEVSIDGGKRYVTASVKASSDQSELSGDVELIYEKNNLGWVLSEAALLRAAYVAAGPVSTAQAEEDALDYAFSLMESMEGFTPGVSSVNIERFAAGGDGEEPLCVIAAAMEGESDTSLVRATGRLSYVMKDGRWALSEKSLYNQEAQIESLEEGIWEPKEYTADLMKRHALFAVLAFLDGKTGYTSTAGEPVVLSASGEDVPAPERRTALYVPVTVSGNGSSVTVGVGILSQFASMEGWHVIKRDIFESRELAEKELVNREDVSPKTAKAVLSEKLAMAYTGNGSSGVRPEDAVTMLDGIDYKPVYNFYFYIEHHADVAAVYANDPAGALRHFAEHGMNEARGAIASFDPQVYRSLYPDLDAAFGDDMPSYYRHYAEHGYAEGRSGQN